MEGSMKEIKKVILEIRWDDNLEIAWQGFLQTIKQASRRFLHMHNLSKALNIFTDTSQLY
eukprot:snap_masked-scaffold_10-processed-gene-5.46-mRNA-1 protein AED:0.41 eAED:0.41 QI:0/-1/0/1/-1/1/1/0/59